MKFQRFWVKIRCMKKDTLLLLARLASSLSLFGIFLCIHITFTLAHFLPFGSKGVMNAVYGFFFAGAAIGAVLCPLFLPLPGTKDKPLPMSLGFIAYLAAVEFIFRSLGVHLWLGSTAARSIMAIHEGMLTTACYGLFYLAWLQKPKTAAPAISGGQENRTGRFCSLVFGAALLASVLARYYSVPLMEAGLAAQDPLAGVAFIFNFIKWSMLLVGLFSLLGVFLLRRAADADALAGEKLSSTPITKTDWPMTLRLVGLASVFTILNGMLGMKMLPLYSSEAIYHPHYLTVAAAVLVLGFLAGKSTSRFIRSFLFPAIVLFILMSCLPLFEENPQFNVVMSTLVTIAYYTVWVVFTTAVVENYAGGFWFYGIALAIFISVVFTFLAPVIDPFVPDSTEYRVLFIVIAAVSFMLLAFRLIFPKQRQEQRQEPFPAASALEDIFKEHGLSKREIEVANLLVNEGLGKKEVGERLFISAGTAKLHISKIYQKFKVNTRAEFMTLFVNREQRTN